MRANLGLFYIRVTLGFRYDTLPLSVQRTEGNQGSRNGCARRMLMRSTTAGVRRRSTLPLAWTRATVQGPRAQRASVRAFCVFSYQHFVTNSMIAVTALSIVTNEILVVPEHSEKTCRNANLQLLAVGSKLAEMEASGGEVVWKFLWNLSFQGGTLGKVTQPNSLLFLVAIAWCLRMGKRVSKMDFEIFGDSKFQFPLQDCSDVICARFTRLCMRNFLRWNSCAKT